MIIYLYVKQHSVTGLKYFGKTESSNPFKYQGSGYYWKSHIKKYGRKFIRTLEVWGFDNKEICTEFALKFSKENNIVESNEWANLREENGLDGGIPGQKFTLDHVENIRSSLSKYHTTNKMSTCPHCNTTGKGPNMIRYHFSNCASLSENKDKKIKMPNVTKIAIIKANTGSIRSQSAKDKTKKTLLSKPIVICPHCDKRGKGHNFTRWHFDKCKSKETT